MGGGGVRIWEVRGRGSWVFGVAEGLDGGDEFVGGGEEGVEGAEPFLGEDEAVVVLFEGVEDGRAAGDAGEVRLGELGDSGGDGGQGRVGRGDGRRSGEVDFLEESGDGVRDGAGVGGIEGFGHGGDGGQGGGEVRELLVVFVHVVEERLEDGDAVGGVVYGWL